MKREEAVKFIHDSRVTSLGEFINGFMVYESTANIVIDKVADELEAKIQELESIIKDKDVIIESMVQDKTCYGCIHINNSTKYHDCEFEDCSRYATLRGFPDMYKPKENKDVK